MTKLSVQWNLVELLIKQKIYYQQRIWFGNDKTVEQGKTIQILSCKTNANDNLPHTHSA